MALNLFGSKGSKKVTNVESTERTSLKTLFLRLERLKKSELSRWWDGGTLKQYIENGKVPRGLRILIFPTFEDLSENLLKEWEHNLEGASRVMMEILVRHSIEKGDKLQEEIEAIEKEINEFEEKELIEKNYVILKKVMENHQIYIKDKKLRKIKRDDRDYSDGRIYTFAKKFDNLVITDDRKRNREEREDMDDNRSNSNASILSTSSNTSSTVQESPLGDAASSFQKELAKLRMFSRLQQKREQIKPGGVVGGGRGATKDTGGGKLDVST